MRDTSIELSFNSTNVYSLKTKRERERVKEQFILFQLIDLLFKDEKKKKKKKGIFIRVKFEGHFDRNIR